MRLTITETNSNDLFIYVSVLAIYATENCCTATLISIRAVGFIPLITLFFLLPKCWWAPQYPNINSGEIRFISRYSPILSDLLVRSCWIIKHTLLGNGAHLIHVILHLMQKCSVYPIWNIFKKIQRNLASSISCFINK